jgi:hypothetical protein
MDFEENKYILEDIKFKLSNIYSKSNLIKKNQNFEESILIMIATIELFKEIIIKLESFENQDNLFNNKIIEFIDQFYEYTNALGTVSLRETK